MVNQGREISLDELLEVLGEEERSTTAEATSRVRLNRLRSLLDPIGLGGKDGLITQYRLNYSLNPEYTIRTDADEFDTLLSQIRKIPVDDPKGLALCGQALELYRGDYLQYTDKDFWFENIQEAYHKDFCQLAFDVVDRINITGNSELLSLLSQRVLAFAGSNLQLHRAVLDCIGWFSTETARKRYITQMMRSGFVADWLSTL